MTNLILIVIAVGIVFICIKLYELVNKFNTAYKETKDHVHKKEQSRTTLYPAYPEWSIEHWKKLAKREEESTKGSSRLKTMYFAYVEAMIEANIAVLNGISIEKATKEAEDKKDKFWHDPRYDD